MENVSTIIQYLDNHIEKNNFTSLAASEANQILDSAGLLKDDDTNSGKPLRLYLRENLLPHAYQPRGN